ncbi:MAG: outer membrane protein assembly factor BamD, partial [Bacteroidota bacterium]
HITQLNFKFIISLLILISFYSCSKYRKVLKSTDFDYKYEMALQYYNDDHFYKALPLFEELITIYRGTEKAEQVYFYYSYCNYNLEDYIFAGYYFKNFSKTYPNSEHAEECQFMNAYCYYLTSPVSSLDQTNTYKAINELQLFINMHPQSSRITECNMLIDELRLKLENKSYKNAKLYYDLGNYKAASVAFNNTLKDFPDTKYKEEIVFFILKSNYLLAFNSVESKKEERLRTAINAYHTFIDSYSDSKYIKEAKSIFKDLLKQTEKYNTQILQSN